MSPVLKLDVEVAPDHRPECLVIPWSHEVHDRSIATVCRGEFIHLNPVESFFFGIVDCYEAEWVVIVPPFLMGFEEGFISE